MLKLGRADPEWLLGRGVLNHVQSLCNLIDSVELCQREIWLQAVGCCVVFLYLTYLTGA